MLKSIGRIILILLGISFVSFLLMYLSPGDPVRAMFAVSGNIPAEEVLEEMRQELGLNRSFLVQYVDWLFSCLRLDFGVSYSTGESVLTLLVSKLLPTIKLTLLSLVFMIGMSLPLGIFSALYENSWIDHILRVITFTAISMPSFWVGLLLLYVFAVKLQWVAVVSASVGVERLILPAFTLAFAMAGKYARQIRGLVLEELSQDYVIGAKSRGLKSSTIIWKHVLPNVMLPLITLFGLSIGSLLGGTAVVEVIFSYPALGTLALNAITAMDYPLIQGYVLWAALIYMSINMIVDQLYKKLDPRVGKGVERNE